MSDVSDSIRVEHRDDGGEVVEGNAYRGPPLCGVSAAIHVTSHCLSFSP